MNKKELIEQLEKHPNWPVLVLTQKNDMDFDVIEDAMLEYVDVVHGEKMGEYHFSEEVQDEEDEDQEDKSFPALLIR